ncbi:tail fiber domain-containing protein [Hymenobacter sp. DH14]|uniref:Tail fiber domain-containing protein n=1 Tax=Hymenobacter cyanobacteriorum TaxID=2926463 RepID=A0A9X2AEX1_9BACT|nr:tail fiber domain-containing protein [Hymenobacter cyanobacteriorum]MCI1187237.1 tail fiber domain-containing protein [Hymenobacter cyanobacteriorum]
MNYSPLSRRALLLALFATATGAARAQNIGVGTLTPSEKLDVVGGNVKISTSGSKLIFPDGTTQGTAATGAGFIQNTTTQQATSNFSISGSGTVGGVVQAGTDVLVDAANGNTGTAANALRFGGSSSGEGIGSKRSSGGNQYGLDFYTISTNRMSITGSGNVGIGTTAPGQKLEVNGNVLVNLAYDLLLRDTNHGLGFYNSAKPWNGLDVNGPALYGYAGGVLGTNQGGTRTTALYWNSTGQVGIGTSSPYSRLSLGGTPNANAPAGRLAIYEDANGQSFYGLGLVQNPGGQFGMGLWGSSGLALPYGGSAGGTLPQLFVQSGGNVGIGTISPSVALDVVSGGTTQLNLTSTAGDPNGVITINVPTTNTGCAGCTELIQFSRPSQTLGSITMNAASNGVNYNTTSDKRLKEHVGRTRFGLADLLKLEVKDYNFIGQPATSRVTGFLAQDLFKVYPDAVKEGDYGTTVTNQWAVDYGRLTPLLVQAIQDQQKEIEALKAQNAALQTGSAADHASLLTLQAQVARLLGDTPPATAQANK